MKTVIIAMVLGLVAGAQVALSSVVIPIESGIHHLGDEYLDGWGLFSLKPQAEATSWQSNPFNVSVSISQVTSARLVFESVNVNTGYSPYNTCAILNGELIGALPVSESTDYWAIGQILSFDPTLLNPSGNIVEIRSGYNSADGNYDDFLFQNLKLEVVPEPASLVLAILAFAVTPRAKRMKSAPLRVCG